MEDGGLHSCLNVKEGDDAGRGGQILVSFLSLNHDDSPTRSFCSPTLTNPVFLTKWSADRWGVCTLLNEDMPGAQLVETLRYAVSIPDGVIEIFHGLNPSSRTMGLGSAQSLAGMSTRNISWGDKGGRCAGLTTLPSSCADCLDVLGTSTCWSYKDLFRPAVGLLTYLLHTAVSLLGS